VARAHFVKKARRAYKADGIKKGESYWWWKFRYGDKHRSKTQPKASQLTQSEFLSTLYGIQEQIADLLPDEDLKASVEGVAEELRNLGSECEDKRSNMPDSLQDSETGVLLEERASACESAADELEAIDFDYDEDDEDEDGVPTTEFLTGKLDEVQAVNLDIE
jgi:hypothetical protein